MKCYINNVVTNQQVTTDIKLLIPDAGLRRRMSRVIKSAVTTAVECIGGVEKIDDMDAIITATGWGCLADSERFLRNLIEDKEQMLNPTPFIQSTFNTVGGQIALLRHNHCYNVTYVNRGHSFEDAVLDAMMRIADGESENLLVGAFDEQTLSQHRIMERMGLFKHISCGEGAVFAHITSTPNEKSIAQITAIDFPQSPMTETECKEKYGSNVDAKVLHNTFVEYGQFPTASAYTLAQAVGMVSTGEKEIIIYNEILGATPTVIVLQCIG